MKTSDWPKIVSGEFPINEARLTHWCLCGADFTRGDSTYYKGKLYRCSDYKREGVFVEWRWFSIGEFHGTFQMMTPQDIVKWRLKNHGVQSNATATATET